MQAMVCLLIVSEERDGWDVLGGLIVCSGRVFSWAAVVGLLVAFGLPRKDYRRGGGGG